MMRASRNSVCRELIIAARTINAVCQKHRDVKWESIFCASSSYARIVNIREVRNAAVPVQVFDNIIREDSPAPSVL